MSRLDVFDGSRTTGGFPSSRPCESDAPYVLFSDHRAIGISPANVVLLATAFPWGRNLLHKTVTSEFAEIDATAASLGCAEWNAVLARVHC